MFLNLLSQFYSFRRGNKSIVFNLYIRILISISQLHQIYSIVIFQANLPPPTPTGRHPGSARSSLSSVRGSPASVKSPQAGSGRPTPVQIGADMGK